MSEPLGEQLRHAAQHLARSPGWQLVAGGAILALAFPTSMAGSVGMAILAAAFGVGVAMTWSHLPDWVRLPPARTATAMVVTVVAMLGISTFWDVLTVSPDWQMGDWGPQHAVLARVIDELPGTETRVWNHAVGTGDAPLELYPKLAYLVVGHLAVALGLEGDLAHAMMIVAVLVHLAIALATTLLAIRLAPRPIAFVVGALALVESGAVAHGGTVGLFRWALLHSALALAFSAFTAVAILGALRRPRVWVSALIWVGTALACATHPAGLISAAASIVALGAVALLASDVPPRRALFAMTHVVLGVALGAAMWMPLAERILAYGQHFPNAIRTPSKLLEDLLQHPSPVSAFAMVSYAGYFGLIAGLWSRRAAHVFVAAVAIVLLVGMSDLPYLALDLTGLGVSRLGTERLAQLARPFIAAAGAYGIAIVLRHAIAAWRDAPVRQRLVAAAVVGVLAGVAFRHVPSIWGSAQNRAYTETQINAEDPAGRAALVAWARTQMRDTRPDRWGRALFESDTHDHFHLTALTGLPSLHIIWQSDLLLRERIEDTSAESLRRFNIRWVIASGRSPALGDPATEKVLGSFHIRELKEWDGQFARVERGQGTVRVTRLDDTAVEVVVDAREPVLVALGTGYYPRWRATHASGAAEPVYALPSIPGGRLHVVSAWLAPGKTTFTVDAPLPSDGKGLPFTVLALLAALAVVVLWVVPRLRRRALRVLARGLAGVRRALGPALHVIVPGALAVLAVRGCVDRSRTARFLEVGSGIRGTAEVQARFANDADSAWDDCRYHRVPGSYHCTGKVVVYDAMASLLNDAPPSWAFNTPGIFASADVPGVELRIRFRERLNGTYWTAVSDGTAELRISDEVPRTVDRTILDLQDLGERTIEIRAPISTSGWTFTFVREDQMLPPRPFLAPPPTTAPEAVRAIRP